MDRIESGAPFSTQISAGWSPESGARPGALVFDAAQRRVWTRWEESPGGQPLEMFVLPLSGQESRKDMQYFVEDHQATIDALLDQTARGRWSEVHELREQLASAWREAHFESEQAVLEWEREWEREVELEAESEIVESAYRLASDGRVPSLEAMEAIWSEPRSIQAFYRCWDESLWEVGDFQILHEGFGGPADEDDPETARRLDILRAERERIESVMSLLFPRQALSIEELRVRYPAMVDAEKRGLAAEWALRVEYKGETPPDSILEPSDRSLFRRSVLERVGVLEQVAEGLRAEYARAVQEDAVEAANAQPAERWRAPRNPHSHRDDALGLIRGEELPERFQRLEGFIQSALPELASELKEPREALQALVQVFERGSAERWVKEERDRLIFRHSPVLFSGAATWPEWDERAYSVMLESLERTPESARGLQPQALEVAKEKLERVRGEIYAPLQAAADRLVEKGEVPAAKILAAQQAVRQGLEREGARWIGQISTGYRPGQLPRMAELAMRVVTRTEAAIDDLEDGRGLRTGAGESPEQRIEEKQLQYALAADFLESQAQHLYSGRADLERALLEQRAGNWVEREWMRAVQGNEVPGAFRDPLHKLQGLDRETCHRLAGPQTDAWASARAREAIERSASADPELRARAIEVAQGRVEDAEQELAERSIEQEELEHEGGDLVQAVPGSPRPSAEWMEELELDELELEY